MNAALIYNNEFDFIKYRRAEKIISYSIYIRRTINKFFGLLGLFFFGIPFHYLFILPFTVVLFSLLAKLMNSDFEKTVNAYRLQSKDKQAEFLNLIQDVVRKNRELYKILKKTESTDKVFYIKPILKPFKKYSNCFIDIEEEMLSITSIEKISFPEVSDAELMEMIQSKRVS